MKIIQLHGPGGQLSQIGKLIVTQLRDGPARGDLCDLVEPFQAVNAGYDFIVVAAYDAHTVLPRPIEHTPRIGIVTDQVSAADHLVVPAFGVRQYGFKGGPVGMGVADNEEAHYATVSRVTLEMISRREYHAAFSG